MKCDWCGKPFKPRRDGPRFCRYCAVMWFSEGKLWREETEAYDRPIAVLPRGKIVWVLDHSPAPESSYLRARAREEAEE